jgi:hypothetical protein|tara:strand:- start:989 stop:1237 length:249 start_codon:yes stop_codon:yes gene_type:complete
MTAAEEAEQWHKNGYVIVRSGLLGEDVVVAKASWDIRPDWAEGMAVYTMAEVKLLVGHADTEIKRLHRIKKMFDGEVVERRR